MANGSTSSFNLPDGRTVEAYLLRDASGHVIIRSREELEKAPAPPATGATPAPPAK